MKFGRSQSLACVLASLFVFLLTRSLPAQTSSGTLRGRVTDPTGAVIPQATVTATGTKGQKSTAATDNEGTYELKGLFPGTYTISAAAKGFAVSTKQNVAISADQVQQFDSRVLVHPRIFGGHRLEFRVERTELPLGCFEIEALEVVRNAAAAWILRKTQSFPPAHDGNHMALAFIGEEIIQANTEDHGNSQQCGQGGE